jgi:hypothetical protein
MSKIVADVRDNGSVVTVIVENPESGATASAQCKYGGGKFSYTKDCAVASARSFAFAKLA